MTVAKKIKNSVIFQIITHYSVILQMLFFHYLCSQGVETIALVLLAHCTTSGLAVELQGQGRGEDHYMCF